MEFFFQSSSDVPRVRKSSQKSGFTIRFASRLAAEIVYLVNRYSEVARGAMIAGKVVDEFLALPAAVKRPAEVIGNPAENCEKEWRLRCGKCSISFAMRGARHDKLPK